MCKQQNKSLFKLHAQVFFYFSSALRFMFYRESKVKTNKIRLIKTLNCAPQEVGTYLIFQPPGQRPTWKKKRKRSERPWGHFHFNFFLKGNESPFLIFYREKRKYYNAMKKRAVEGENFNIDNAVRFLRVMNYR